MDDVAFERRYPPAMGKVILKLEIEEAAAASAAASGIDLLGVAQAAVDSALAQTDEAKAARWAEENAEALKAQRERIDAYGVFGEDLRAW